MRRKKESERRRHQATAENLGMSIIHYLYIYHSLLTELIAHNFTRVRIVSSNVDFMRYCNSDLIYLFYSLTRLNYVQLYCLGFNFGLNYLARFLESNESKN